jgi:hypothetical protein
MEIDRRALLTGVAGALLAAKKAEPATTAGSVPLDEITLYRKLHLRSDDGELFWWLQGPKIGQVGARLTSLYTSCIGTIQRVRHRSDGGFDVTQLEMIVMLDLETGRPLDRWRNPYTGEEIPIRFSPVGPVTTRYAADNTRELPTEIGGTPLEATATINPPLIVGDDVFQRDESIARVFTPGRTEPFEVNDIAVYHGSLANLSDPAVTVGEATVFFAEVTSWQRWMNMGSQAGTLTSRLTGRKVRSFDALPQVFRDHLLRVAPEIAADPVGALDKPPARFER